MKKKIIIAIFIVLLVFIIIVGLICYYITREYKGEYSIQYPDNYNYADNMLSFGDFTVLELMTYSEYVDYCNEWDLEINYSDEECNYIIMAGCITDNVEINSVINLKYKTIIFWSDLMSWEARTGLVAEAYAYIYRVIIIPTMDTTSDVSFYNVNKFNEINEIYEFILKFIIICILPIVFIIIILFVLLRIIINKRKTKSKVKIGK